MRNPTKKFLIFKSKTTFRNIFRINDFEQAFFTKKDW